jgi:hypothetical protein
MNESEKTIGARMNERKAGAVAKVKALLWADAPDVDQIAAVALGAGLSAVEVGQIEKEVAGAKALLTAAAAVDVAELARASAAAVAAEVKATAAAERASAAAAAAWDARREAEQALSVGKLAVDRAAQAAMAGSIPSGKVTASIKVSVAAREAEQLETERAGKAGILRTKTVPKLRQEAAAAAERAGLYQHLTAPGIADEKTAAIQSAKAARERLADAEKELSELLA